MHTHTDINVQDRHLALEKKYEKPAEMNSKPYEKAVT